MNYQVNISFTQSQVRDLLTAGRSVTIVKGADENRGGSLPVAWIVFRPSSSNTIEWMEDYYLYESTSGTLSPGVTIGITTSTPAQQGIFQTFQNSGFSAAGGQTSPQFFGVLNKSGSRAVFGLAQAATVNRRPERPMPLNAALVENEAATILRPSVEVTVFLSQSRQSEVIRAAPFDARPVDLNQNPVANFTFDPNRGFVLS